MHPRAPIFESWLQAERSAQAAERDLRSAILRCAKGEGPPPKRRLVQRAAGRRRTASCLFAQAMQELKEIADSLHYRNVDCSRPPARSPDPAALQ